MKLKDRIPCCPHTPENAIVQELYEKLDRLEEALQEPLLFTSGYRCEACNKRADGVVGSSHIFGKAVDCRCSDSVWRFRIVEGALQVGFRRIGIGSNMVHLDVDKSKPQGVIWLYPVK